MYLDEREEVAAISGFRFRAAKQSLRTGGWCEKRKIRRFLSMAECRETSNFVSQSLLDLSAEHVA
jgi:hypothetical protein